MLESSDLGHICFINMVVPRLTLWHSKLSIRMSLSLQCYNEATNQILPFPEVLALCVVFFTVLE